MAADSLPLSILIFSFEDPKERTELDLSIMHHILRTFSSSSK